MGVIYKNGIPYGGSAIGGEGGSAQTSVMPAPSSLIVNKIVQYVGPTTFDFTNGYFYKCIEDKSVTPSTFSWEEQDVQPGLTSAQKNALIALLEV